LLSVRALDVPRLVSALFAFAAGIVDACTYLALFGLFVAQVTGSFVIVGVQMVDLDLTALIRTLAIPVFFLVGGATAFLVMIAAHPRSALAAALGIEIVLLGVFIAVGIAGAPFTRPDEPLAVIAGTLGIGAMGMQSALVRLMMPGTPSTNVMTTNTTQAALDLAQLVAAARRAKQRPDDVDAAAEHREARAHFGMLWPALVGFLTGTICGAVMFNVVGFWSPLVSLGVLSALLLWVLRAAPRN
jgi:uncharacterized membrane protein YoaK (UPF0700 family)